MSPDAEAAIDAFDHAEDFRGPAGIPLGQIDVAICLGVDRVANHNAAGVVICQREVINATRPSRPGCSCRPRCFRMLPGPVGPRDQWPKKTNEP